jgi:hypothetical protein
MNSLLVVKKKVFSQAAPNFRNRLIMIQVNLLVLHRSPETLHENVVKNPAPPIHANPDLFLFQAAREI